MKPQYLFLLAASPLIFFSTNHASEIGGAIEATRKTSGSPGALAAWQRGKQTPELWTSGNSSVEGGRPISIQDHMRIGSVSKLFIGTLILRLVDDGDLSLDEPVAKYVAGVPGGEDITLRHLGNHTSGLQGAIYSQDFQKAIVAQPERIWKPEEILAYAYRLPSKFDPGKGWNYANTNTLLLALVAEKASGMKLGEALKKHVFDPLELQNSGILPGKVLPKPHTNAYRYGKKDHPIGYGDVFFDVSRYNASWTHAAGDMYATIEDLIKVVKPLCQGELLSPATRSELHRWVETGKPNWKYGFCIEAWNGLIGHRGDVPGYQALIAYDEKEELAIAVVTNLSNTPEGKGPANEIAGAIRKSTKSRD